MSPQCRFWSWTFHPPSLRNCGRDCRSEGAGLTKSIPGKLTAYWKSKKLASSEKNSFQGHGVSSSWRVPTTQFPVHNVWFIYFFQSKFSTYRKITVECTGLEGGMGTSWIMGNNNSLRNGWKNFRDSATGDGEAELMSEMYSHSLCCLYYLGSYTGEIPSTTFTAPCLCALPAFLLPLTCALHSFEVWCTWLSCRKSTLATGYYW